MKKILFTLLACFTFFGFSSAYVIENQVIDCGDIVYNSCITPLPVIPKDVVYVEYVSSVGNCQVGIYPKGGDDKYLSVGEKYDMSNLSSYSKVYIDFMCRQSGGSVNIKYYYNDPPLLPGGKQALSGAVNNLSNSVKEFIPYIVYVGLGILGVLIGFVAIKWLINWVRYKILGTFKK